MTPRFVVFDTETTGFTNASRVLELGMVFCEEGQIIDTYLQRFNPSGVDWNSAGVQQALSVNGLTQEDLQGQPDFSKVADHIEMLLGRYQIWVAHHMAFDLRMISNEFLRISRQLAKASTAMKFCTLEHDKALHKRVAHKLEDTCGRYGVKLGNAHTAVGDATATAEVFLAMVEEGRISKVFRDRMEKVAQDERVLVGPIETPSMGCKAFSY